jgi:hypothetical protein
MNLPAAVSSVETLFPVPQLPFFTVHVPDTTPHIPKDAQSAPEIRESAVDQFEG